ncbi:MAG TPA: Clp protease N-terminal domain-containing protein [Bryobacteraceae bacterium]|nr:Clp protease N-terminal domain-containing protein [Bryobacteraceae bacterium]
MFERYVEKSRRVIFFARYEASQLGSPYIETEHLLLGILREDKSLAHRFLPPPTVEAIRLQIEQSSTKGEKILTSVDLPLSHECRRVLAYGAEEAEQMHHKHIGTHHLLLGLLREDMSFAAQLLQEHGVGLARVREEVLRSDLEPEGLGRRREPPEALVQLLRAWEEQGGVTVATDAYVANHTPDFAIYVGGALKIEEQAIAQLIRRFKSIVRDMENAIANHEFEQARHLSQEEHKLRERLRQLCERHNLTAPAESELRDPVPVLCIEIVRDERFSNMRKRFADYLSAGVEQVWALDFSAKRAYTVTTADGLREFAGETLRMTQPALELKLAAVFP